MVKTIAEIGINHNSDMGIVKKLIDVAASAGVDYVKFQKRNPDRCVPEEQKNIERDTPWGRLTYLEYRWRMEFGKRDYDEIDKYCRQKGIGWFASVWDKDSIVFMSRYDTPYIKIPSALITDTGLIAASPKPLILSTGMSDWGMVDDAVWAANKGAGLACLMHCVSTYPSKAEEQNLNCIPALGERYAGATIGFSNHFPGLTFIPCAVALGAEVIEFHITLDRSMWGTDQSASIEPEGVYRLMKWIRSLEAGMGDGEKRILSSEIPIMQKLRRVANG